MFFGNLTSDFIGGIFVGLFSETEIHLLVFSIIWTLINLITLFLFQKSEIGRFETIVKREEIKLRYKTTLNSRVVWILIRLFSSFIISLIIGFLVLYIKNSTIIN